VLIGGKRAIDPPSCRRIENRQNPGASGRHRHGVTGGAQAIRSKGFAGGSRRESWRKPPPRANTFVPRQFCGRFNI
jgi:hypothetical protein